MAVYLPPSFYSSVFDSNAFTHDAPDGGLTQAEADLLYYHYPIGQAFETLQQTDHTGLATFNAGIDINTGTLKFPDNTVQTTAATAGTNLLPLNNVWTGTNEFQQATTFDSALIVSNGNQYTSLGNGFLPLASGQGTQNVFVGVGAGSSALCGGGNTVVGYFSASQGMTSASSYNTLYGERAGQYLTSGVGNTCIGATNCNNVTTGNSNICLGYGAMAGESSGALSNNIVIGNGIQSGASNRIIIGDTSQTSMDLQVIPTALGGGVIRMNNNLSMNNTTAIANRQISSTYYNFYASNNVSSLTYSGRFYGNLNSIVYDCPDTSSTGSSSHIFYNYNNATPLASLTISNLGITSDTPQPASNNSTNIVPTTAWVQGAITAGAGTNLIPANNTWTGTNAFNNVAPITSTATQPASNDSSTKIPTTAWVQGAITAGAGTNLIPANNTWTGTNAFNNVAPITSTATQPASNDSSTKIPTTAWVQSAIGTPVNPQSWGLTTGNIANAGGQLVNGIRYVVYNYYGSNISPVQMGAVARFEFQYSVYGVKSASSGNYTLGTIDQCGGASFPQVNNPNTITTFDLNLGYLIIGSHSTQYITNVQTTSNYWNASQTYYPKNAPTTPYTFQPLTLMGNATVGNPKQLQFLIGFPQNISIGGSNALGDMSCGCASLRIISSPPSTANELTPYSNDTLGSLSAGSWYFQ